MIKTDLLFLTKYIENKTDIFAAWGVAPTNSSKIEDFLTSKTFYINQISIEEAMLEDEELVNKYKVNSANTLIGFFGRFDSTVERISDLNSILLGCKPSWLFPRINITSKANLYFCLQELLPDFKFLKIVDIFNDNIVNLIKDNFGLNSDLILKPNKGSGSDGVYRKKTFESVELALNRYRHLLQVNITSNTSYSSQEHIVMNFLKQDTENIEFCVDGFVVNGAIKNFFIHEKIKSRLSPPFFDKVMVCPPIHQSLQISSGDILNICTHIVNSFSFTNGVFHFEVIKVGSEFIPIDAAFRTGGGFITHAIYEISGIDLRIHHILSSLNVEMELKNLDVMHCSTCIGVLFARDFNFMTLSVLYNELSSNQKIFAYHIQLDTCNDAFSNELLKLSIGFKDESSKDALESFLMFKEKFSFTFE